MRSSSCINVEGQYGWNHKLVSRSKYQQVPAQQLIRVLVCIGQDYAKSGVKNMEGVLFQDAIPRKM